MHVRHRASKAVIVVLGLVCATQSAPAQVRRIFPSERSVVTDAVTGNEMVVLTDGRQSDAKIYQTHPQWSADGKWIIFRSSGRSPGSQAYAVNEQSGAIVQLTEGAGNNTSSLNIARKSMKLYFLRNATAHEKGLPATQPTTGPASRPQDDPTDQHQVIEIDLERLLADAIEGRTGAATSHEKVCATLPQGLRPGGGAALDANEQVFYFSATGGDVGQHLPQGETVWVKPEGMRMGTGPGGLRKLELSTGRIEVVLDSPFQIGHVQANPWVSGEILYCHETGGDAPQRMWTVQADGSGNRPLFVEGELDWVTHETVVTRDEVMFNLIGHQKRLRARPTGIAVVNLRTDAVELLGQLDERAQQPSASQPTTTTADGGRRQSFGGFWHCNGSADGRWAVGDTFGGNLWLIDRRDGRRILLSTDHKMRPDHTHPTFSDDSSRILIQSGHFTDGQRLQLIVIPIPASP